MGSENPPLALFDACIENNIDISFVFIGTFELKRYIEKRLKNGDVFLIAKNVIFMEENPLFAIRRKKDSSLAIGLKLLKQQKVDAFITAGSTGALVSASKLHLDTFKTIHRPALLASIPGKNKSISILDVGANISFKAKFLIDSAKLGISYSKSKGIKIPKVGLLNIGSEAKKGNAEIQKAYQELKKLSLKQKKSFEFVGNIEALHAFEKDIDVLITDGFSGNVFLKTAEGIANFLISSLESNISQKKLQSLQKYLHHSHYPGALLIGLKSIVIKCHSYCSLSSFVSAIKGAKTFIENKIISHIEKNLI